MFALLLCSLLSGLLLPVYTDEVAWRFQLSRFFQDGGIDYATGETCGPNTAAHPALFMLPVRAFSSLLTAVFDDPMWVRIAGVGFAIVALVLIRAILRRATPGRSDVELLAWSLFGLGVLPYLLVWSRPEQPVLLCLLGMLLVRERRWAPGAIAVLAAVALSYHLKALFYLPVFVAAIWLGSGGKRAKAVATAAIVVLAAIAYRYWSDRFACPNDPLLAAKIRGENAAALLAGGDWRALRAAVPQLLRNALPATYLTVALPAPAYMSSWLPGATLPFALLALWHTAGSIAWYLAFAAGAAAAVLAVREGQRRALVLPALLLLCATGWATLQTVKNSYESALYLPALVFAIMLALAAAPPRRWLQQAILGIALISAASQIVLAGQYLPKLWTTTGGGYVAHQPYSLSAWNYPRARVIAAGAKCGIRPGDARVLIDDMTYFAYSHGARPMHRMGVLSDWNGSLSDPLRWLHDNGSPGAVIACAYLPPDMRRIALATGDICCVRTR